MIHDDVYGGGGCCCRGVIGMRYHKKDFDSVDRKMTTLEDDDAIPEVAAAALAVFVVVAVVVVGMLGTLGLVAQGVHGVESHSDQGSSQSHLRHDRLSHRRQLSLARMMMYVLLQYCSMRHGYL